MRLSDEAIASILSIVQGAGPAGGKVRLFGSRTDQSARGGDIDLLVEYSEPVEQPAWLAALLSTRISRALEGRAVDVIIAAPNVMRLPIHDHAYASGTLL